jgi:hypothetical protein
MLIASFVTAIGGILWVYVAVVTYRGQMNAQVFLDCNERYSRIMASFPKSAWEVRLNLSEALPPPSIELTLASMDYLNLSSEEFYLFRRGYVHRKVWEVWEAEMIRTIRSPLFRREWKTLRQEFESFPEFVELVERAQAKPHESAATVVREMA